MAFHAEVAGRRVRLGWAAMSAIFGPGLRDLGSNGSAQSAAWRVAAAPARVPSSRAEMQPQQHGSPHARGTAESQRRTDRSPHVKGSEGPGTKPGVVATMPSLISSRQRAGQPIAAANRCASVVLPDPAGPLTITKVGHAPAAMNYPRVSPGGCFRITTAVVRRCASSSRLRNDPLAVFSAAET